MRWYMHPAIKDTVLSVLLFFQQEIPPGSRSGRLKFQGGQVMLILEGQGYTLIDGVKHPWKAGDLVNLPLRADAIIVQPFNTDQRKPAGGGRASVRRSATIPMSASCARGRSWPSAI